MSARAVLASGLAAGALLASGAAGFVGLAAVLACGVVVLLSAVLAMASLLCALPARPALPAGVAVPLTVVATTAYLVVAPVALHVVGVRLTTASAALVAMALPATALRLGDLGHVDAPIAAGAAVLVAVVAAGALFAPAIERYVDVTTPTTEFSSLSFSRPLAGGVTRVTGPLVVDVVHRGGTGSGDDVTATFAGGAVAPLAVTMEGTTMHVRYSLTVPPDGCEHLFEVRAAPVGPGRPAAGRGDEAALDDASRATLRLAARFAVAGTAPCGAAS